MIGCRPSGWPRTAPARLRAPVSSAPPRHHSPDTLTARSRDRRAASGGGDSPVGRPADRHQPDIALCLRQHFAGHIFDPFPLINLEIMTRTILGCCVSITCSCLQCFSSRKHRDRHLEDILFSCPMILFLPVFIVYLHRLVDTSFTCW